MTSGSRAREHFVNVTLILASNPQSAKQVKNGDSCGFQPRRVPWSVNGNQEIFITGSIFPIWNSRHEGFGLGKIEQQFAPYVPFRSSIDLFAADADRNSQSLALVTSPTEVKNRP
jgi:hypothetical protein